MRIIILLLLALALATLLALFPQVAGQDIRIEAFGWLFETKQGPFIIALILLLALFWAVRRLLAALMAGPGQLWKVLRTGGRKRREMQLREGLAQLIDLRDDLGAKTFRKIRGVGPRWGHALLQILSQPASGQKLSTADDDPLQVALAARIATDPQASPQPDLATRKAHLQAWRKAHPGAPLATARLLDVAEEEQDWTSVARLLEEAWKKGARPAAFIKPKLAHAYLELSRQQPEDELECLRKAHRLMPESTGVLLALGRAYAAKDDLRSAQRLWSSHLEKNDDGAIAQALFELLSPDALRAYRKMEKEESGNLNPAQQWLRAQLAHEAELTGLAFDHMQALLDERPSALSWKTMGDWHDQAGAWQECARCYKRALEIEREDMVDSGDDLD